MPPEIIFACSDLRHLTGGLRFAGIAERFCKVCRHIGPQGKAGAPTQAAGTMQPAEPHPVARRAPSPRFRVLVSGLCAPGSGLWALDSRPWALGFRLRALGFGLRAPGKLVLQNGRSRGTCAAERTLSPSLRPLAVHSATQVPTRRPKCSRSSVRDGRDCPAGPGRPRCALLPPEARCVQADTYGGARRSASQQNAAGARNNMQVFTFFGLKRK